MIVFKAFDLWEWDLTSYGITFNEESDIFFSETKKNFTFPINIELDEELAAKLGLVILPNITNYNIKINGYLFVDNTFYDAYIMINETEGTKAELQFYYGTEVLSVFDKKLSKLPWPVINAGGDFRLHAGAVVTKAYPETSHNFPMVYRPGISKQKNYEFFEGFINHYGVGGPKENYDVLVEDEPEVHNINVVAPMPYLLEILRVGFASEGKEIRGEFPNDELFKKAVVIPSNFLENYANTASRVFWQFQFYDSQETINFKTINVYEKLIPTTSEGFYKLRISLNFPKGIANFFQLHVYYGANLIYNAISSDKALTIEKTLYQIVEAGALETFRIELKVSEQVVTIAGLNNFTFNKEGGDVNIYPNEYTLADFMPDITFREYFNALKKWLGLDVTYLENAVYLNYLNTTIRQKVFNDHTNLEIPEPTIALKNNNLFRLYYKEEEQLLVANNGVVYTDEGYNESEIEELRFDAAPISIGQNAGRITGVYPEENAPKLIIGLYNGMVGGLPLLVDTINSRDLQLENIYENFHKYFLSFRANSETYKDSFYAHVFNKFNLTEGIYKYNKKHLIKTIRKRRISEEWWKVDQETESF